MPKRLDAYISVFMPAWLDIKVFISFSYSPYIAWWVPTQAVSEGLRGLRERQSAGLRSRSGDWSASFLGSQSGFDARNCLDGAFVAA